MENASKALIMAGTVIIGTLILSLFVYLFTTMGEYTAEVEQRRTRAQVDMFNSKFTKYVGAITYNEKGVEVQKEVTCTIHDVITIANLAKQNNIDYGVDEIQNEFSESSLYIQVDFLGKKNLEKKDDVYTYLKKEDMVYKENEVDARQYKCILNYSNSTGRVNYVKFINA